MDGEKLSSGEAQNDRDEIKGAWGSLSEIAFASRPNGQQEMNTEKHESKETIVEERAARLAERRSEYERTRELLEGLLYSKGAGQVSMDIEITLGASFFRQQGHDLIKGERRREEWEVLATPPDNGDGRDAYYFQMGAIDLSLRAMEALSTGKSFDVARDTIVRGSDKRSYVELAAARIVAHFSERGTDFAEYAGIADLDCGEESPDFFIAMDDGTGNPRAPFQGHSGE